MNLSAVYELRDRLETAAVAGMNLISEDFRLKRAVQQMEPYAKASPVFRKIYEMAQTLILPECQDRAGTLLDTLGLVDAVLCTQGILQTDGEIEELEPIPSGGDLYSPIPYSRLAPVREAFKGVGGGRYAVIANAYKETPEIFKDYRMIHCMVQALGDPYGELAEMVAGWLQQEGEAVLPVLKQGFDPQGKRDMVRRVQVIEAIRGGQENNFYRYVVESGGKETREAAIQALRHDQSNLPLLLDLQKSEKGKLKEAVLQSLSYMDGDEAEGFWAEAIKKKPAEAAGYLSHSTKGWVSDLIADELEERLKDYVAGKKTGRKKTEGPQGVPVTETERAEKEKEEKEKAEKAKAEKEKARLTLVALWNAAQGKHSDKICLCYEKVYQVLPKQVPAVLTLSLIQESHPSLCQVAEDMYRAHGDEFLEPAFLASLFSRPAEETYSRFSGYLRPEGLPPQNGGKKGGPEGLIRGFDRIFYDERDGCYWASKGERSVIRNQDKGQKIKAGLDLRWYPLLMGYPGRHSAGKRDSYSKYRSSYDWTVANLYRPDVEGLQKPYGEYFYEGLVKLAVTTDGIQMLKRCGWTKYEGILLAALGKNFSAVYLIRQVMKELPLTKGQLADELDQAIQANKKRAVVGIGLMEQWRDALRSGTEIDNL